MTNIECGDCHGQITKENIPQGYEYCPICKIYLHYGSCDQVHAIGHLTFKDWKEVA